MTRLAGTGCHYSIWLHEGEVMMYGRDIDEERVPLLAEHREREPPNAIHLSDDYRKWHIEWFLLGRTRLPVYDDPTGRLRESGTKWPLFIPLASVADCCVLSAAIIYNGGLESLSDNMWLGPSLSTIVLFGGTVGIYAPHPNTPTHI